VNLSAVYSPKTPYKSFIAKNSGSLIDGALNTTPIFKLAISSSLMNNVDGVKKGYSILAYSVDD